MENTLDQKQEWTEIISPKAGWFDIKWKELWRYKDLMLLFVKRDFIAQYKQTILGPLWHFIQPILTTVMFLFIFGKLARIPTDGIEPRILFYMSGITIWNYFSTCLTGTSTTFISNANIFGKVYFPRLVLPLATIISNIVKFCIQFFLLLSVMVFFGIKTSQFYLGWTWLLIPLLVLIMAGIGLGLGIIISSLTTKYRDFNVLIGFGVQLTMYATPIAYPLSHIVQRSSKFAWILKANPLTPVVEGFRYAIFRSPHQNFQIETLGYSFVFMIVSLIVGLALFNKVEKSFMDTV